MPIGRREQDHTARLAGALPFSPYVRVGSGGRRPGLGGLVYDLYLGALALDDLEWDVGGGGGVAGGGALAGGAVADGRGGGRGRRARTRRGGGRR